MYKVDPNDSTKTIPKPLVSDNPSFIQTFATDAAAQVANPGKGVMTFSYENGHGDIFVYNGTAWKKAELVAG
mgnify:FL=1|tara:strand:- start:575 stop:790 length:216 start_codon:yes stop_codon:yes gene_type:complete